MILFSKYRHSEVSKRFSGAHEWFFRRRRILGLLKASRCFIIWRIFYSYTWFLSTFSSVFWFIFIWYGNPVAIDLPRPSLVKTEKQLLIFANGYISPVKWFASFSFLPPIHALLSPCTILKLRKSTHYSLAVGYRLAIIYNFYSVRSTTLKRDDNAVVIRFHCRFLHNVKK